MPTMAIAMKTKSPSTNPPVTASPAIGPDAKAREMIVIQHNLDVIDRNVVGWLEVGDGGKQVTVRDLPQRDHIDVPVRESLIVELYSK